MKLARMLASGILMMGLRISTALAIIICSCSIFSSLSANEVSEQIRIRIDKEQEYFFISGIDLENKVHKTNKVRIYPGQATIKFDCDLKKYQNQFGPKLIYSISSPSGVINIKGQTYFGRVDVVSSHKKSGCDLINILTLETYISTLLAHEMNASWPIEALKAQAVAARSYALYHINTNHVSRALGMEAYYDLENSEKHQVSGNINSVTKRTNLATSATKGQVLKAKPGEFTPIFYHARCGGKTFIPSQVWGNSVGAYKSVSCPGCKTSTKGDWKYYISNTELVKFLAWVYKKPFSASEKVNLVEDSLEKSNLKIYHGANPYQISKSQFRKYFGRFKFFSNLFQAKAYSLGILVAGKGLGHGVGMCQIGAHSLAQNGTDYKTILKHYFPDYKLVTLY
jgi:stage II sporulation protein D